MKTLKDLTAPIRARLEANVLDESIPMREMHAGSKADITTLLKVVEVQAAALEEIVRIEYGYCDDYADRVSEAQAEVLKLLGGE